MCCWFLPWIFHMLISSMLILTCHDDARSLVHADLLFPPFFFPTRGNHPAFKIPWLMSCEEKLCCFLSGQTDYISRDLYDSYQCTVVRNLLRSSADGMQRWAFYLLLYSTKIFPRTQNGVPSLFVVISLVLIAFGTAVYDSYKFCGSYLNYFQKIWFFCFLPVKFTAYS